MPTYDYQCQPNGHRFEVRQGINEPPVETCPECGGPVRRVIHPVGIVFKGSGFYATDSRGKSKAAEPKPAPSGESAPAPSGDSKPESGGESTSKPKETKSESSSS